MEKWENQIVRTNITGDKELEELINSEGRAGWELVSVLEDGQNNQKYRLFFKRHLGNYNFALTLSNNVVDYTVKAYDKDE